MMKQKDTMYEKFAPGERIALMVEAMARQDYNEADRIIDTCERKHYEMADARYAEGFRAVHTGALIARVLLLQYQSAGMAVLGTLLHYADKKGREDKKRFAKATDQIAQVDAGIRGTWFAWEQFCADAGVDADKAFAMGWSPASDVFKLGLCAALLEMEPPEPCPDAYKRALEYCQAFWARSQRIR